MTGGRHAGLEAEREGRREALDGLVVIRGGGDLGTGVGHRLHAAGYRVVVLEVERPTVVRRTVSFAEAVTSGRVVVEGVEARRVDLSQLGPLVRGGRGAEDDESADSAVWPGWIPVVVDPEGRAIDALSADALVDARMAKTNLGTSRDAASVTIGLGPGFDAGGDVDFVVETARGHSLGRVIEDGAALPNTGVPGLVMGVGAERVIRAPADGRFEPALKIGDIVREGDAVGTVGGTPARARTSGLLRGLVASGLELKEGQKMGDVDPRGSEIDHARISDKARSIGGAVLEALLRARVFPERPL